jgi:hypothetical protein
MQSCREVPKAVLRSALPSLLLDSQREEVYAAVKRAGFAPREFELEDVGAYGGDGMGQIAELWHRPTGFRFAFRQEIGGGWWAQLSPGSDSREERTKVGGWQEMVMSAIGYWLAFIKREVGARDPWRELESERQLARPPAADDSNAPFTAEEQEAIRERLRAVHTEIAARYELPDAKLEAVIERLDYIADAAERMGRMDWRQMTVGTLFTLAVEAAIPPDVIRTALSVLFQGITHLFGSLGLPELPA